MHQNPRHSFPGCTIAHNRYGQYCVPLSSSHRPAAKAILAARVHEPLTLRFIGSNCGEGDIVHAGAFFGDFLPALSRACSDRSKVWAFEPNPENYRCARATLQINGLSNVELRNAALGSRPSCLPLKIVDGRGRALGGRSRILKDKAQLTGTVLVEVVPLDQVICDSRNVSIIHLDVEGYELAALRGAIGTIRRCRPILVIEALPGSEIFEGRWFVDSIRGLGYEFQQSVHRNRIYRSPDSTRH
jgi:FkbM family methyltransferase